MFLHFLVLFYIIREEVAAVHLIYTTINRTNNDVIITVTKNTLTVSSPSSLSIFSFSFKVSNRSSISFNLWCSPRLICNFTSISSPGLLETASVEFYGIRNYIISKYMYVLRMYISEFLIGFEAWAKLAQQWLVCVPLGIHFELMLLVTI